jgi:Flp pilus assembly protein TadB
MKAPPITIRCECGESRDVAYGEQWTCESCGRRWDTRQIPAEEYEGLLRRMRRARLLILAAALVLAAVIVPLIVFVSARFIGLAIFALFIWLFVIVPYWRRNVRREARSSPRWELSPE